MKKPKTIPFDVVDYFKTPGDIAAYLVAAFEDGDAHVISHALGNILRARGMPAIARKAGVDRKSLYKALSADGNPELATFLKVMQALGLRLHAEPG